MKKPKQAGKKAALQKAPSPEHLAEARKRVTGSTAKSIGDLLVTQMGAMQVWGTDRTSEEKGIAAVDLLQESHPASVVEAFLSVQMFGVHEAALLFLHRATVSGQTFEGSDANVLRAVRLLRLFNEQVELLAKLKGKTSQQKVTVEHIHVHQGGQAIVGAVSTTKADRGEGS
jgi:hypothetical protein